MLHIYFFQENIRCGIYNSNMDKSKIYAMLQVYVVKPLNQVKKGCPIMTSYSTVN